MSHRGGVLDNGTIGPCSPPPGQLYGDGSGRSVCGGPFWCPRPGHIKGCWVSLDFCAPATPARPLCARAEDGLQKRHTLGSRVEVLDPLRLLRVELDVDRTQERYDRDDGLLLLTRHRP